VEEESVLLGLPGAPGCTTTGFNGSFCCAATAQDKTPAKAGRTARQRNRTVIFTTGLQDKTRTPAIAMLAPNTQRRDFEDEKWRAETRSSYAAYPELNASCSIMGMDFGEAASLTAALLAYPIHWS
jgi:hypothetical protein